MAIPGSNIRLLRRQMGISLEALAEASGVNSANLSRLETGKGGYSPEGIQRIARALSVSTEVLFSDPEKVEGAALLMREAPVLTPEQLVEWHGADTVNLSKGQASLWGDLRYFSRHVFGWKVMDGANIPYLLPGDELVFDGNKQPQLGDFVIAHDREGSVYLGRFKRLPDVDGNPMFEVLPYDNIFPGASSITTVGLELKGTLVQFRRMV